MPALGARLAVPDLAAMLAIVTLVWCLFVFDGGRNLFRHTARLRRQRRLPHKRAELARQKTVQIKSDDTLHGRVG